MILTQRELQIVELILDGHNNESISHQLDITINTVKRHVNHIMEKTESTSRLELAVAILKQRHEDKIAELTRYFGDMCRTSPK